MRLIYLAITLIIIAFSAQARIAANRCVTKIHDILEITKDLQGETIGVFDWDETISKVQGGYAVRESEDQGTLPTLKAVQDQGIKTMILTSRMKGLGLAGGIYGGQFYTGDVVVDTVKNNDVPNMLAILGKDWQQHGPLKTNDLEDMPVPGKLSESGAVLYAISKDQIVFAGGEVIKGETLALLIDKDKFTTKPNNIIFVDNDDDYTLNVEEVFRNRPENVYIFRYPGPRDEPCPTK